MKVMKKFILLCITILVVNTVNAQVETHIVSVFNSADSTYKLAEISMIDLDTVNVRFFPTPPLTKAQYGTYLYNEARNRDHYILEIQKNRKKALDDKATFVAFLDTLNGAGFYDSLSQENLKTSIQGSWKLITKRTSKKTVKQATITDLVLTAGAKTGTITITGFNTIDITGYTASGVLSLKFVNGILRGKKGNAFYVLRRR